MSMTYPHDRPATPGRLEVPHEEPFVPVYARSGRRTGAVRKGGFRPWMVLAPIGVLVLGAGAAAILAGGEPQGAAAPVLEPAPTAPVLSTQPASIEVIPMEAATPVVEATPALQAPPVARRAESIPVRRTAPPAPVVPPPAAPAPLAGPQPYTAALNAAPTSATPPAPPPPVIVIQPAN